MSNILVFDTETTNLEKPHCYNIGYVIRNSDTHETLCQRDFVVEQIWHNLALFVTAYYADKRPMYVERMRKRETIMDKFGYITQTMFRDIKNWEVTDVYAYNSPFDIKVFDWGCDWFKCLNPLETVKVHDIRGHVHKVIAFTPEFQAFCDENGYYTESGNYSTTAETVYRFITGNTDFIEEHTALSDSKIEADILQYCVEHGAELTADYKVYATIPRYELKQFTVIDAKGIEHSFDYTNKRFQNNQSLVKLTIKNISKPLDK